VIIFQKYISCNKCAGPNKLVKTHTYGGFIEEAETVCESCGFNDYWSYGFFDSSSVMEGKSETYIVGSE
jgi:hypothetical protein